MKVLKIWMVQKKCWLQNFLQLIYCIIITSIYELVLVSVPRRRLFYNTLAGSVPAITAAAMHDHSQKNARSTLVYFLFAMSLYLKAYCGMMLANFAPCDWCHDNQESTNLPDNSSKSLQDQHIDETQCPCKMQKFLFFSLGFFILEHLQKWPNAQPPKSNIVKFKQNMVQKRGPKRWIRNLAVDLHGLSYGFVFVENLFWSRV